MRTTSFTVMVYSLHFLCIKVFSCRIVTEIIGNSITITQFGTTFGFSLGIAFQSIVFLFQLEAIRRFTLERTGIIQLNGMGFICTDGHPTPVNNLICTG